MYTDRNRLIYQITVPNVYDYIKRDLHKFDTSDYSPNNIYRIPLVNKKILGLIKDECNGKMISEFVGLRSKLYAYKVLGEEREKKKAKGVDIPIQKILSN